MFAHQSQKSPSKEDICAGGVKIYLFVEQALITEVARACLKPGTDVVTVTNYDQAPTPTVVVGDRKADL